MIISSREDAEEDDEITENHPHFDQLGNMVRLLKRKRKKKGKRQSLKVQLLCGEDSPAEL
ncbi:hypothetical protein Bca4012_021441 [Brassica carinata]